jgi:peroxiredoxin
MIDVGATAPDFVAPAVADGTGVELELYRLVSDHRAVVLTFAPADFVPTCTATFAAIRDAGWHDRPEAAVVALTGDSLFSGFAYVDRFDLPFPLVADFHGDVADSYDLLAESWEGHAGIPRRATVVLDDDWTVRFAEATRDALDRPAPAPVENATATLRDLGIDVDRPRVEYEGGW